MLRFDGRHDLPSVAFQAYKASEGWKVVSNKARKVVGDAGLHTEVHAFDHSPRGRREHLGKGVQVGKVVEGGGITSEQDWSCFLCKCLADLQVLELQGPVAVWTADFLGKRSPWR